MPNGGIFSKRTIDYTFFKLKVLSYLKSIPHSSSSLKNILDHVLPSGPHLVTLVHEVFTEAHPVGLVCAECRGLKALRYVIKLSNPKYLDDILFVDSDPSRTCMKTKFCTNGIIWSSWCTNHWKIPIFGAKPSSGHCECTNIINTLPWLNNSYCLQNHQ